MHRMGHPCSNTCYKPCLAEVHKKLTDAGVVKEKIEALMRKASSHDDEKGDDKKDGKDKKMPNLDDMKKICG